MDQCPWDRAACDILGPLPLTYSGNKYIIVYSDYLTKYVEAFALPDITAVTVAKSFVYGVISRHGCPRQLLTDCGAQFTSQVMREVCTLCSVSKIQTSPYHPQCDGLIERANRTILDMLAMYSEKFQKSWDESLNMVLFAYRSPGYRSLHECLRFMPFMDVSQAYLLIGL